MINNVISAMKIGSEWSYRGIGDREINVGFVERCGTF
jgi:hypothetical protein